MLFDLERKIQDQPLPMVSVFRQPHPPQSDFRSYLKDTLLITTGVAFVLSVLQPFGLDELTGPRRWTTGLWFGAVTLGTRLLNYGWIRAFPRFFREDHWTLGRKLLWASYQFVSISWGNFLLGRYLFPRGEIFFHYGPTLLVTVMVGLFPSLLTTYASHNRHLRRHLQTALELNQQLGGRAAPARAEAPSLHFADAAHLLPPIRLDQLLYVEAAGNYLRIWVLQNGQPTDYRLRATLKQQEELWAGHPQLLRCHRAFMVNLDRVQQVSGNSAGYRLTLHPDLPPVPVSRGQAQAFKRAFQGHVAQT